MKHVIILLIMLGFMACTKTIDVDHKTTDTVKVVVHDTVHTKLDTFRTTTVTRDTVVKYNSDTVNRDVYHTDTLIIRTERTDTIRQIKYDTFYLLKVNAVKPDIYFTDPVTKLVYVRDTITRTVYITDTINKLLVDTFVVVKNNYIIQVDSVVSIDTVYGLYAQHPSSGINRIKVNQYSDPGGWNTHISHIMIGNDLSLKEYIISPDGFIDVPMEGIDRMVIYIEYPNGYSGCTVQLREYFDPIIIYRYALQTQGPSTTQSMAFPYFDTGNIATITLSDFGLDKTGPESVNPHKSESIYKEIKN